MTEVCRVLFVCYANVCRSPLAEGLFRSQVHARGLQDRLEIDSAGTCAMEGSPPHAFSQAIGAEHGLKLRGPARQLHRTDLDAFDHILVMDRANARQIRRLASPGSFSSMQNYRAQIRLLGSLAPGARADTEIADPIGQALAAYAKLYAQLEPACAALLEELTPAAG